MCVHTSVFEQVCVRMCGCESACLCGCEDLSVCPVRVD